jgi:hypothetical protein
MEDYQQEPSFQAPLLYQLYHAIRGTEAPRWSATDYAMGLNTGPLRGPRVNVPQDLQRLLQQGPGGSAPTVPQWTNLERPWSGIYKGGLEEGRTTPSPSWRNPTVYNLGEEAAQPQGNQLQQLLRTMGPSVDMNSPELLRNSEFFQRFLPSD